MAKRHRPLSHSARETYKSCARQFFLSRELRLEPIEKKTSLRMGTAFGTALEHRNPERAAEGYFEGVPADEQILDDTSRTEIAQVKLIAELYLDRYRADFETPGNRWTPEFEFNDPIAGKGFLDGVVEQSMDPTSAAIRERGGVYAEGMRPALRYGIETKLLTKGMFWNEVAIRALAIDDQVTAYFYAMRELGKPLDHLRYRVQFKPGIKPDGRIRNADGSKGEKLDAYIERLRARIEADPSYAFEEHILYRSDAQLDRFAEEAAEVNEHVKLSRRRQAWPQNSKSCTNFGGCAFLPLCRDDAGAATLYRERKPDPAPLKLPRLGKVQRAVLLASADAFDEGVNLATLHQQVSYAADSVTTAVKSLERRGLIAYWRAENRDTGEVTELTDCPALTPEGRAIAEALRVLAATASDAPV